MTEMLKKEFSRKSFVKGGGAMIVGFSLGGAGLAGRASAADSPFASNGPPDLNQVDSFITIHADNTASIRTGRVELGQGTSVGLLQIAGEELEMEMSQLRFVVHDTNVTPSTGATSASSSVRTAGPRVRSAAATARQALLGLASTQLGVPVASLSVSNGVVSGGGRSVSYGQLIGDKRFNVAMASQSVLPGVAPAKSSSQYRLVTTRVPRLDVPSKVVGSFVYVHAIRVPGMLHGRVVRPRGQGAYGEGTNPKILSIDESSIKHIPDVRVLRRGNFLGVVAPQEYAAIQAAAQLKVTWAEPPSLPSSGNLWKQMRADDSAAKAPARIVFQRGNVDAALASAAKTISATYKYGYNGHAVIGPSLAVADVTPNGALIMANSQDLYGLRAKLPALLGLPASQIRIKYYEGSSTFGNSLCRFETSCAAAVMSQLAGGPVRLQMMRWDEHGWDHYSPAQMTDMRGGVDSSGKLVGIDYTGFQLPHVGAPVQPTEQMVGQPVVAPGPINAELDAIGANATIPNLRVTIKSLPPMNASYLKWGTVRAPGEPQAAFAYEQMLDELAYAAKIDPYQFRVQNVSTSTDPANAWFFGERWLGVLNAVAKAANWQPRVAASTLSKETVVAGRGISASTSNNGLAAVVADIEVNKRTGKIVAKHLYAVQDSGLTINPALAENQLIGAAVMSTSRVLHEEVRFDTKRVTSLDWVSYPILRFKDHPKVTAIIVQRADQVSVGAGEIPTPATVSAIANAFFDATGVRIRETPMTPAVVRATLKAAGVA